MPLHIVLVTALSHSTSKSNSRKLLLIPPVTELFIYNLNVLSVLHVIAVYKTTST